MAVAGDPSEAEAERQQWRRRSGAAASFYAAILTTSGHIKSSTLQRRFPNSLSSSPAHCLRVCVCVRVAACKPEAHGPAAVANWESSTGGFFEGGVWEKFNLAGIFFF